MELHAHRDDVPAASIGLAGEPVSSASKALALLDALAGPRAVIGVSELADLAGMPKSTAHRLLVVLIEGGYVRRVEGKYALSSRIFELGNQVEVARANGLRDQATPFMAELFAQTRQTVHLAVLSGQDILYVDKLWGHDSTRINTVVGTRRPAYATGLGKAMLASGPDVMIDALLCSSIPRRTAQSIGKASLLERELVRIRETGVAYDREEARAGVFCSGAAVRSAGWPVAGVSLGGQSKRFGTETYANLVREAATRLSRRFDAASLQATGS